MATDSEKVDSLEGRVLAVESRLAEQQILIVKVKRYVDSQTGGLSMPPPPQASKGQVEPITPPRFGRSPLDTGQFLVTTEIDRQFSKLHDELAAERSKREAREAEIAARERQQYDALLQAQRNTEEARAKSDAAEADRLKSRQKAITKVIIAVATAILAIAGSYSAGSNASSTPSPTVQGE